MRDCCKVNKYTKKCIRIKDKKIFMLPRKFSRKKCLNSKIRGFTMRASCSPYKFCKNTYKGGKKNKKNKKKLEFLYNPNDPKKSFDVYIDKNPNDTIPIKYTTIDDVKNTINKLERLYKTGKYPHKRIWQVGMIMYVRLKVLKKKKPKEYNLSKKYFRFLGNRTKLKTDKERKHFKFSI
tara:strand:+ start:2191 stop:2727 length:537 start_codon:yes stop_codon:yes gene_type:complete